MFRTEYPRDVARVSGPDAASYLQSQLSQDIRAMQVGDTRWSFLLQPTGKVDVLLRIRRTADEEFVLDTDAGFGETMVARINRFKIRVKADVELLDWPCVAVRGADAARLDGAVPSWGSGYDLFGSDAPADLPAGSADDLLAARIDAAWPAMGAEIVPGETIPAETGITDVAVSFTKGCYPGQELVERMDSRAVTAPRLLQRLDAAEAERLGARVTSRHGDVVLAYVPRSALAH
ncbi:MAG: YgfZ/GcvT domain-containing protein [Ilumatobacteraceae bacterium]